MVELRYCSTDSDFSLAIKVTKDYIRWLNMDLSFQDINKELLNFSSIYNPPNGFFILATYSGKLAGGCGLKMLEPKICEMKRLFVYDQFKNMGIGRNICTALIGEAKNLGYERMRLDTLKRLKPAIRLYKNLGFEEIGPYRYNPDPTAKYMELSLSASAKEG